MPGQAPRPGKQLFPVCLSGGQRKTNGPGSWVPLLGLYWEVPVFSVDASWSHPQLPTELLPAAMKYGKGQARWLNKKKCLLLNLRT